MSTGHNSQGIREERSYRLSKDWIPYRGPFGGEGWQHIESGEVRYVQEAPGDIATEEQTQTALPGEGFDLPVDLSQPKWLRNTGTLANIIEETIQRPDSDVRPELEITDNWVDDEYESSVQGFLNATSDWIKENGDSRDAARLQEALQEYDGPSPWGENDAPGYLNPEEAEKLTPLYDTNAKAGISADSMMVAEMESGDRAFITNADPDVAINMDSEADFDLRAAEQAATFLDELGVAVPDHHYEEGKFLSVAEADGRAIGETMGRLRISKGEFASFAATQLLIGNTDGHSQNVFSGYNGLEVIDLDFAGNDFSESPRELEWGLGKLFDTAVEAGIYEPYNDDEKDKFLDDIRGEVQGWASRAEEALESVEDDEIRERFRANIELAKRGELISEDQEIQAGL